MLCKITNNYWILYNFYTKRLKTYNFLKNRIKVVENSGFPVLM